MLDQIYAELGEGEFTHRRPFKYLIKNPNQQTTRMIVYLPYDFWEEGRFEEGRFTIKDEHQKVYPHQKIYTLRGAQLAIDVELKPLEIREIFIEFHPIIEREKEIISKEGHFKGDFYEVLYNDKGIEQIMFKDQPLLIDDVTTFGFPVYQLFKDGKRQDAAGFGYSQRKKPSHQLFYAENAILSIKNNGRHQTTLRYEVSLEGTKKTAIEITLYRSLPLIHVCNQFAKDLSIDPEGMYVMFPLNTQNGEYLLDKPGTWISPDEKLPDTCADYYTIDRGVILKRDNIHLGFHFVDTPLVTFNRIKLWEFNKEPENKGSLYAWLLNNKWETNFRTDCAGYLEINTIMSMHDKLELAKDAFEIQENQFIVLRK
jgi:hypothetical protein